MINVFSSLVLMEEDPDNVKHTWVNLEELKEMFSHEGSSFYLRLGALGNYCVEYGIV